MLLYKPEIVTRNLDEAHRLIADACIRQSFAEGDQALELSPWLPVSVNGEDASRGWLMQDGNQWYDVTGDEPQSGIFPQLGIGDNAYSILYATPKQPQ